MKKYLNIREVSKIVGLKEHVIRYWDSIDPKTNKLRVEGISTKSSGGTRYFNKENLNKLQKLKNLIYEDGDYSPSLKIANKFLSSKKISNKSNYYDYQDNNNIGNIEKLKKIDQILKKMRIILK
tara:strand:- start:342 stop:713 length:372 start_codon:yes stop_codon:yes gene_type:complete